MITPTGYLHEKCKIVTGIAPATHDAATCDYVCMKGYHKLTAILIYDNDTTVTGNSVTISQATAVAGTGAKTLTRTTGAHTVGNTDTGAGDALSNVTLSSNAFTTDTTNAKNLLYVLEVDSHELDRANGFDCVAVALGATALNTVGAVIYILWPSRYADADGGPTAITD